MRMRQISLIREMEKTDIDRVAEIWLDSNVKTHDFIPVDYWKSNFEMVKQMFVQAEIYLYEEEKKIQGFIGMEKEYIAGCFVAGGARSQGIGKCLLDFVKERNEILYLKVYQKNMRAIHFYKREGFQIQKEVLDEATCEKEYKMIWRKEPYDK